MTKEQSEILRLAAMLHDRMDIIEEHKNIFLDYDYPQGCHYAKFATISEPTTVYQVLRTFDIEMMNEDPFEYIYEHMLTDEQRKLIDEDPEELYGDVCTQIYEDNVDEIEEHTNHFEICEIAQQWINLKTGHVTYRGKIYKKDHNFCDFNAEWTFFNPSNKFYKRFIENGQEDGYYYDIAPHPWLQREGYECIDAFNFAYSEGLSAEAQFYIKQSRWSDFLLSIAKGTNPLIPWLQEYGMQEIIYIGSLDTQYQKEYIAALRIAHRNHYLITDMVIWKDMVKMLYELHKDLHNAFYVCPQNLQQAHDKWLHEKTRKHEKEMRLRRQQREAEQREKTLWESQNIDGCNKLYQARKAKFFGIKLVDAVNDIVIEPLKTIQEFQEEGRAMHNCVYMMGYYRKEGSLIFSARNSQNERLATIEYNLNSQTIAQCRADHNTISPYEAIITQLIMNNIKIINNKRKKKTV